MIYTKASNDYTFAKPQTQAQKLAFFQDEIQGNYIAPTRNKHIFSVMSGDTDNTFYFSPNYEYGTDNVTEYQQVVIIDDGGGGTVEELYWEDM